VGKGGGGLRIQIVTNGGLGGQGFDDAKGMKGQIEKSMGWLVRGR